MTTVSNGVGTAATTISTDLAATTTSAP